jgi:hypothetical protein
MHRQLAQVGTHVPDPTFHPYADPDADPCYQNDADPCGSGSTTLRDTVLFGIPGFGSGIADPTR